MWKEIKRKEMGSSSRYINPYTDFGFKKLFGSEPNKDLLIAFLNALLHGKEEIKTISYLNTEHFGTSESDRKAVFDVYCTNEKGEIVLVEMQRGEQQFFKDRSIYYSSFSIQEQGRKGIAWQYQLKAVYVISILNFTFKEPIIEDYLTEVKLLDIKSKEIFYDKLTFIYIEMPKFNKSEEEIETLLDKWLFILRNLSSLFDRPIALQGRIFSRLFEEAEIAKYAPIERAAYEDSLKVYRDWESTVATAVNKAVVIAEAKGVEQGRKEGLEEGRKEGLEEGKQEEKKRIALSLKQNQTPIEIIAKCSGLTIEEIELL